MIQSYVLKTVWINIFILFALSTSDANSNGADTHSIEFSTETYLPRPERALIDAIRNKQYPTKHGRYHHIYLKRLDVLESTKEPIDDFELALRVFVTIKTEGDINSLISMFSPPSEASEIKSKILKQFREKTGASIKVPLEEFLPLEIRKNVHSFPKIEGPNCLSTALCSYEVSKEVIDSIKILDAYSPHFDDLIRKYFVAVDAEDSLQPGDILVYDTLNSSRNFIIEHASTVITKDIIYTKNGNNLLAPYIFQKLTSFESFYPNGDFVVRAYRPKSRATTPHPQKVYIRFGSDEVEFLYLLSFDIKSPPEDQHKKLDEMLKNLQPAGLIPVLTKLKSKLSANEMKTKVQNIIDNIQRYKDVYKLLLAVGFSPLASTKENTEYLEQLYRYLDAPLTPTELNGLQWIENNYPGQYSKIIQRIAEKHFVESNNGLKALIEICKKESSTQQ